MKDEFFLNISIEQYKIIHDVFKTIDDKVKNIMGIIIAIFPIIVGIGYYLLSIFSLWSFIFFGISLLSLFMSTVIGYFAYMPIKIDLINPKALYDEYYQENLDDTKETIAVTIGSFVENMSKNCVNKSDKLKYMLFFLLGSNICLLITFIFLFLKI